MSRNKSKDRYWNRTSFISFVLAVLIIIRHNSSFANYRDMGMFASVSYRMYTILRSSLTELSVPAFFVISGYNFFNGFDFGNCKNKLLRRAKSLLVPYWVWNSIYCAFAIITSYTFISRFFIGREKYGFSLWNIITGCLYHENCNGHFWFIFDLILFVIVSPLIFPLLKNKYLGGMVLIGCWAEIFLLNIFLPEELLYRTDAIIYYLMGGYIALRLGDISSDKKNLKCFSCFSYLEKHCTLSIWCGTFCSLLVALLLIPNLHNVLRFFVICMGIMGIWLLSIVSADKKFNWIPSGGTVFLIYASHGIIQPIIVKLFYLALPKQGWVSVVNFSLSVVATIVLCVLLKKVLSQYMKPLDKILCGWRR